VTIEVFSPAFESGTTIPKRHTGEGDDVSPPLEWSSLPQGTKEIAIICDDPHAPTSLSSTGWHTRSLRIAEGYQKAAPRWPWKA
jgi:phosphatidylethanolamine-binding protein (PEBP) family uncharacterized protein